MGQQFATGARMAVALGIVLASAAGAQTDAPGSPKGASGWRVIPEIESGVTYDDNVFLLAPTKEDNLDPVSAGDLASGRYADMEAAHDLITALRAAVDFRGTGWMGRRLTVTPEARYNVYASSSRRSHARLGLTLEQDLPRDGRLRLRERYTPSYFAKNYLADAVDLDGGGTISSDERRYRAGNYAENEASVDWRFRLAKARRERPMGVATQLGVGYYLRTYDAPFAGRDLRGPTAAAALALDLGPRAALELGYDVSVLSASADAEVMLLDEPDFGIDFNGNGNATDVEVRTVQTVDRSRTDHEVSLALRLEASPRARGSLSYALRTRSHGSDQPYDIANRGRHDRRHVFEASLGLELAAHTDLTLGGEVASQTSNRAGDPGATGDEDDYDRHAAFVTLSYRR